MGLDASAFRAARGAGADEVHRDGSRRRLLLRAAVARRGDEQERERKGSSLPFRGCAGPRGGCSWQREGQDGRSCRSMARLRQGRHPEVSMKSLVLIAAASTWLSVASAPAESEPASPAASEHRDDVLVEPE